MRAAEEYYVRIKLNSERLAALVGVANGVAITQQNDQSAARYL